MLSPVDFKWLHPPNVFLAMPIYNEFKAVYRVYTLFDGIVIMPFSSLTLH